MSNIQNEEEIEILTNYIGSSVELKTELKPPYTWEGKKVRLIVTLVTYSLAYPILIAPCNVLSMH